MCFLWQSTENITIHVITHCHAPCNYVHSAHTSWQNTEASFWKTVCERFSIVLQALRVILNHTDIDLPGGIMTTQTYDSQTDIITNQLYYCNLRRDFYNSDTDSSMLMWIHHTNEV